MVGSLLLLSRVAARWSSQRDFRSAVGAEMLLLLLLLLLFLVAEAEAEAEAEAAVAVVAVAVVVAVVLVLVTAKTSGALVLRFRRERYSSQRVLKSAGTKMVAASCLLRMRSAVRRRK